MGTIINLTPTSPPVVNTIGDLHFPRTASYDIVDRMLNAMGGQSTNASDADYKTAVRDALREFQAIHRWNYFVSFCRIPLSGMYDTGTVTYDFTGGAYERLLTLASGTWPTWARFGYLKIDNIIYKIQNRIDGTRLQLDPDYNPGEDLAALTTYELARNIYTLPSNVVAIDRGLVESIWGPMEYETPNQFLSQQRYRNTYGPPRYYTFMGAPIIPGRMSIGVDPAPDSDQSLDFTYLRRMRDIETFNYTSGKATVSLSTPSTVTLSGGSFASKYIGSIIRLSTSANVIPTRIEGKYPYNEERTITNVISETTAYVDQDFTQAYTGVGHQISDPIDIEDPTMLNAFTACAMKMLGRIRRFDAKQQGTLEAMWANSLDIAKESDDHDSSSRGVDLWGPTTLRLRDMPRGADIS